MSVQRTKSLSTHTQHAVESITQWCDSGTVLCLLAFEHRSTLSRQQPRALPKHTLESFVLQVTSLPLTSARVWTMNPPEQKRATAPYTAATQLTPLASVVQHYWEHITGLWNITGR